MNRLVTDIFSVWLITNVLDKDFIDIKDFLPALLENQGSLKSVTFNSVYIVLFHLEFDFKNNLGGQISDWSSCFHMSMDLQKNLGLTTWRG